MADEQENKTGFDTSEDFHADTSIPGAGGVTGDSVDFEKSLPRPISEIKNDISTPREKDESDSFDRKENRDS
jgi:hypothetical protein